jgi:phosphoglycolate phosphatase-like HAD superfamily hydrolase
MLIKNRTYPTRKDIYIDVDGTLIFNGGEPNLSLIEWLRERKAEGYRLYLWSARGEKYAASVATRIGVLELFAAVLPKPGYVVDDLGHKWDMYINAISIDVISENSRKIEQIKEKKR